MKDQHNLIRHYISKFDHIHHDFRARSIRKLISQYVQGKEILDAGCGSGDVSLMLVKRGHNVTAIDPEPTMLAMTNKLVTEQSDSSLNTFRASIDDFANSSKEKFDTVICLDVIEHIEDDQRAFDSLIRLLKPGGRLILTVPSLPSLYGPKDKAIGHYRRYSKTTLLALIDKNNLGVSALRYWNFLGVLPTTVSVKLLRKPVSEQFRYSSNILSRTINALLTLWFENVENRIHPPIGLTLVLVVKKEDILSKTFL